MSRDSARLSPRAIFAEGDNIGDVVNASVRGGAVTFAAQGARFATQTVTTVVLARLLTPDDFGLVAMVALVVGFAQTFKDAGLSLATVQRERITREQIDTLFWVNLAISCALAAAVAASAPLVAGFFHRPELASVTVVLSLSFLIGGLTIQHDALLRRHLRFGALAVVQVASQVVSLAFAVAVALLLPSHRYWALVVGNLAAVICATALTFYYCPLVPRGMRRGTGVRDMLAFGGHLTGFEFVNYFARNLDNLLVGRFLGADSLGLYSKAYQLFMLPITQIRTPLSQVAVPVLSRLRTEPERYRAYYVRLVQATAALTIPVTVYCLLEAPVVIRVLLGGQWMGAVRTFQILAVAGLVQPATSTAGLVMVSQGRADRQMRNGLVNSLVLALAFVVGLRFGIEGVAAGFTIGSCIVAVPLLWYGFKGTPILMRDFARAFMPPAVAGAAAAAFALVSSTVAGRDSTVGHVLFLATFVAAYLALSVSRRSVRDSLRQMLSALKADDVQRRV